MWANLLFLHPRALVLLVVLIQVGQVQRFVIVPENWKAMVAVGLVDCCMVLDFLASWEADNPIK